MSENHNTNSDENALDQTVELHYSFPVSQLLQLGDPDMGEEVDFAALGIGDEHIPELIRLATDEVAYNDNQEGTEVWGPGYAQRALGELQASEAVEPLLRLLDDIAEMEADWLMMEIPFVLGQIGPVAIPAVQDYLADEQNDRAARISAATCLREIATQHPASRDQCVEALRTQLQKLLDIESEQFSDDDETLTTFVMSDLVELRAMEALPLIEAAFTKDRIDISIRGDWEQTQITLGLLTERQTPEPHWFLAQQARKKAKTGETGSEGEEEIQQLFSTPGAIRPKKTAPAKKSKRKQEAKSRKINQKKKKKKK